MVGWHYQFNGHEFEQTLGDREGQGSLGALQFMELQRIRHDLATEDGEGNGTPLQYSCLENPMDRGAW